MSRHASPCGGFLFRSHTATTESALLWPQTKSSARLLNLNRRRALVASCLDEQARFFPHSALSGNRGQGRKLFSRSFLPLFQTCTAKGQPTGANRQKENKHETSKLNSHSDRDSLHWAFATSAGSGPAARRRLSQLHHRGRAKRAEKPHHGRCQHGGWLVFTFYGHQWQLQHRCWRWNACAQYRGRQYGHWRCSALAEHHG